MATLESSTVTRDLGYAVPSVAADYPATVNSGDQLVMEVYARNAASISTPTGWSLEFSNTNFLNRIQVFSRTADGTEGGGTVTLTFDTDREAIVKISRFSSASGIDVHGAASDDFLANVSSPSVTTTVANTLLYFGLAHTSDGTGISAPSGTTAGSVDALRSRVALAHATQAAASAGATSAAAWTNPENFAWPYTIAIAPASAAATLSSPTSASVTQTGVTIGATTDSATGTLYGVVTTSASAPSATQIKAGQDHTGSAAAGSGSNASLTASANNTIAITGLTAATTYYYYLVQDNGADSNVVNGTFTTAVAAPTLTSPTAVSIGTTTVTPRVTTDTGNGTCYYVITPQAESEPSNTQVEAGTNAADGVPVASGSTVVSGTPPVVVTFSEVTGLTAGTAYRISYAHSGTPS